MEDLPKCKSNPVFHSTLVPPLMTNDLIKSMIHITKHAHPNLNHMDLPAENDRSAAYSRTSCAGHISVVIWAYLPKLVEAQPTVVLLVQVT